MANWADRLAKLAQALATAGTVPDTSISTAETDVDLVFAPDGAGGIEARAEAGGSSGYAEGTSFPGSPANNDKFFRTDLDLLFFYDGTRWLTTTLYRDTSLFNNGVSATATYFGFWPTVSGEEWWVEKFDLAVFQISTGNGSNFWAFQGENTLVGSTFTNLGSGANTNPHTAATWARKTLAVAAIQSSSALAIRVVANKTGAPGNLYGSATMVFRRIAT